MKYVRVCHGTRNIVGTQQVLLKEGRRDEALEQEQGSLYIFYLVWCMFELCLPWDYISRRAIVGQVALTHSKRILGFESD